jgi:hypothetical protein
MSAVEYFRVGVRTHAILLAEGLLSASGNRGFFGCPIREWVPQNMTGIEPARDPTRVLVEHGRGSGLSRIRLAILPEGTER